MYPDGVKIIDHFSMSLFVSNNFFQKTPIYLQRYERIISTGNYTYRAYITLVPWNWRCLFLVQLNHANY